jgi:hypothetical protein
MHIPINNRHASYAMGPPRIQHSYGFVIENAVSTTAVPLGMMAWRTH